jgi:ribonuclease BN (tRNA processing enzyme)
LAFPLEAGCPVKITLVPSSTSAAGVESSQYLTTFIVNDHVAIDAGALGFYGGPLEQAAIRHVFVSHSHIDHLASLPIFLENVAGLNQNPVTLHASEAVQECLRLDVFNNRLWPNFLEMTLNDKPFVSLETIKSGEPVEVEGLRITPVAVHHAVPTLGFIIEDQSVALVICSDTGPTEEIWKLARKTPNLKAVFLEATFPDVMTSLADLSLHLRPADFVREMRKLALPVPFFAVHLKARFREQVMRELLAHQLPDLEIAKFGTSYEF